MYSVIYFCVFALWLSLLQDCCKSAARMLDSRFAARLPARPRPRFKIIAARLLHGCCKACCKIVVRVLQECFIQGLLQACCKIARPSARAIASRWLLQDCCKNAARLASRLSSRLAVRLLQSLPQESPRLVQVAARLARQLL